MVEPTLRNRWGYVGCRWRIWSFELWCSAWWWRHHLLLNLLGSEPCFQILILQPLLHEGHKLVCLNVFEASLCSLRQEPREDIFISVLLALLVSHIEGVAGLLVESRECVGRMDEGLFQLRDMLIGSLTSDQRRSLAWSLAREPRASRYFTSSGGLALESDSTV